MSEVISIDLIKPDPNNPRKIFTGVDGLARNIKSQGMIHAIEVDSDYMIIVGERRYQAAKKLKLKKVRVEVNKTPYTPLERLIRQMSENLHQGTGKQAMNPLDTANGWNKIHELSTGNDWRVVSKNYNYEADLVGEFWGIVREMGLRRVTVWDYLRLLDQSEDIQNAIRDGKLPYSYMEEFRKADAPLREQFKNKMLQGEYKSSRDLREDIHIAQRLPELSKIAMLRERQQESAQANRILNGVVKLGLALEAVPLDKVNVKEQAIVIEQLAWLFGKIDTYLPKANDK